VSFVLHTARPRDSNPDIVLAELAPGQVGRGAFLAGSQWGWRVGRGGAQGEHTRVQHSLLDQSSAKDTQHSYAMAWCSLILFPGPACLPASQGETLASGTAGTPWRLEINKKTQVGEEGREDRQAAREAGFKQAGTDHGHIAWKQLLYVCCTILG
jgi:hypothetical protein